jgi:creatinine amidohydrolase
MRIVVSMLMMLIPAASLIAQEGELPFHRMDYYSWQEFATLVPEKVDTVILPVGTQEAHGVVANGADALVPERLAEMVAPRVNAFCAPVIPYGMTTSLAAYPGGFAVSRETFKAYCLETVRGLADCGFRNIVIFNGHGPNRAPLDEVAAEVSRAKEVRILVVDWWSYCAELTREIWGADEDGGHAGLNENAAVMALNPRFARPDLYDEEMTVPIDSSYTAYPNSGTILLYSAGKGYPEFDEERAQRYLERVAEELAELIETTRSKWERSGVYQ